MAFSSKGTAMIDWTKRRYHVSSSLSLLEPEIYRRAASTLTDTGNNAYCCNALYLIAGTDGYGKPAKYYCLAFEKHFGPKRSADIWLDRENLVKHPFWDQKPTPARQALRRAALLKMADLVEKQNSINPL